MPRKPEMIGRPLPRRALCGLAHRAQTGAPTDQSHPRQTCTSRPPCARALLPLESLRQSAAPFRGAPSHGATPRLPLPNPANQATPSAQRLPLRRMPPPTTVRPTPCSRYDGSTKQSPRYHSSSTARVVATPTTSPASRAAQAVPRSANSSANRIPASSNARRRAIARTSSTVARSTAISATLAQHGQQHVGGTPAVADRVLLLLRKRRETHPGRRI